MKKNMLIIKFHLKTLKFIILMFVLLCLPLQSYSSQLFYTIQTGSFQNIDDAKKQYESLVQRLDKNDIDHLRIEKIGQYHSVRLGKYNKKYELDKYLNSKKKQLSSHLVMKAYYLDERIEKLYVPIKTKADDPQAEAEPANEQSPVNMQTQDVEKIVDNGDEKSDATSGIKEIDETSGLAEKKRDEDALEAIKAKLEVLPEDPELNGRYGTMLFRLKQPSEAIPYLKKAAELSPKVPEYNISIGYCYLLLSKFNEAVDEFNKAVNMSPSHVGALTGLGISYSELGDKDKAMGVYDKLKTLDSVLTNILLQIIEET